MITLGIDTSNYASSVAVIDYEKNEILLNEKQFLPVKQGECGLRQQDAVFGHIKNLIDMLELVHNKFDLSCVQAVGVSVKPTNEEGSYMPCFLVGKLLAQMVKTIKDIPVIQTTHQDGHLNSALFSLNNENLYNQKIIVFHVSGGTTDMILVENGKIVETVGSSNDLFAGQAVDRLGVKLGFPFPAGVYVSQLAAQCDEIIKPKVSVKGLNCNLSGLQNQCEKLIDEGRDNAYVCRYCLSFIARTLIKMAENAREEFGNLPIVFVGGVMSSQTIKEIVQEKLKNTYFVEPVFSSDNAIGTAAIAARKVIYG
ncbi:MAG: glycoprotease [Ruminococcaceae bacterium]|nr:glycoprotease [Oscillospiraceae bacterium]